MFESKEKPNSFSIRKRKRRFLDRRNRKFIQLSNVRFSLFSSHRIFLRFRLENPDEFVSTNLKPINSHRIVNESAKATIRALTSFRDVR